MASLQEMLAARNVAKVQTPEIQTGIVTSANADSAVINGTAILNQSTNTDQAKEEEETTKDPGREPIAWAPNHIQRYMCDGWKYPDTDGLFRASTQKQFDSLQNMAARGEVTPIYAPSEAIE